MYQIRVRIYPSKTYMKEHNLKKADEIIIETDKVDFDHKKMSNISNDIHLTCLAKGFEHSGRSYSGMCLIVDVIIFGGLKLPDCEVVKSLVCEVLSKYKDIKYTITRKKRMYDQEDYNSYEDGSSLHSAQHKYPYSIINPAMFM